MSHWKEPHSPLKQHSFFKKDSSPGSSPQVTKKSNNTSNIYKSESEAKVSQPPQ